MTSVKQFIIWPVVLTVLLFTAGAEGGEVKRLTIEEAVELALSRNPAITASRSQVEAAHARVTQARAGYLPQVSASTGYNRKYSDTDGSASSNNGKAYDQYQAKASMSQLIYDFGSTTGKIDSSRHSLKSKQASLTDANAGLVRDVRLAFLEVLKKKHLVAVSRESLTVQQKHLAQAEALYEQGMRPRIDVTKGKTEVSQAKLVLLQAEYDLKNALAGLENVMGGPPASGAYELADVSTKRKSPERVEPLTAQALEARQDLAELKSQVQAAKAGLESVRGDFWPSLSASGSYTLSDDDPELKNEAWLAGVTLSWDVFTGFRRSGEESEAKAEIRRLNSLVKSKELSVTQEVTEAFLTVREAFEAVGAARVTLRQAKENLDQAEGRYQAGISDAVELSDAQVLYTSSQGSLVRATYTHMQAWAALEYATGNPPPPKTASK